MKSDFFLSSSLCSWRIIVFDEAHLISRQGQSALLKVLEEMPANIFCIFCTTDVERILPTIRSRSIELVFRNLTQEEIKTNLKRIVAAEKLDIPENIIDSISMSSKGHARDSVMALQLYSMMEDKKMFESEVRSAELLVIDFLVGVKENVDLNPLVERICTKPLDVVRSDFYLVLRNTIYRFGSNDFSSFYGEKYTRLVSLYGQDCLRLFSYSLCEWASNSFRSDITVQGFLWALAITFRKQQTGNGESLLERAKVKRDGDRPQ